MGKPVTFRRGIATVIPDCASGTVSQIASLKRFPNVCDLQTMEPNECYIKNRLKEARIGAPSR